MVGAYHQRRLQYRLAALFWLVLLAALASLWWVQRQWRIERNARLDQFASHARRLLDFSEYGSDYNSRWECDRRTLATCWLMQIARQKKIASEEEDALQNLAVRLKSEAAKVRILYEAGSKGGEEHEVAYVKSRRAQVRVALVQISGSASEVRTSLADYIRCLRDYRDAICKARSPEGPGAILAEIDLAAARVVQAEWNRDRQAQIAALGQQLAAVEEFARLLSKHESNSMGVIAADYAAARIQSQLACLMQDEPGEIAAWEKALDELKKLCAAERAFFQPADNDRRWTGGEIDFAMRLPQPNLLLDAKSPEPLSPQAKRLKRAVLEELIETCRLAAEGYQRHQGTLVDPQAAAANKYPATYNFCWDALASLAEIQLANADDSRE